jgi:hypothetical protein
MHNLCVSTIIKAYYYYHRCTVVENLGRGTLNVFWQTLKISGYMRCPSPRVVLCLSLPVYYYRNCEALFKTTK